MAGGEASQISSDAEYGLISLRETQQQERRQKKKQTVETAKFGSEGRNQCLAKLAEEDAASPCNKFGCLRPKQSAKAVMDLGSPKFSG